MFVTPTICERCGHIGCLMTMMVGKVFRVRGVDSLSFLYDFLYGLLVISTYFNELDHSPFNPWGLILPSHIYQP